jgi:hypothetical protein
VLCTFFALPQGRAFASALLLLFRGQTVQPISTDSARLKNAYATLEELERLGTLQGTVPYQLTSAPTLAAAGTTAGFTPALPTTLPTGMNSTPATIKAVAPTTVTLTLSASIANAYLKSIGSSQTLPAQLDGEQIIVDFPGVTLLEYVGPVGSGKLFVGQAGQLVVNVSGNASVAQVRSYLLTLPGLSSDTVTALQNISNWQSTIPLGIPTDRAGWTSTTVGGSYGGSGVLLNDNTGTGSAVVWQRSNGSATLGIGGWGIKASEVQTVAGSLH